MSAKVEKEAPKAIGTKDDTVPVHHSKKSNKMAVLAAVFGVMMLAFMGSTIALAVQKNKDETAATSPPVAEDDDHAKSKLIVATAPRDGVNPCEGKKPKHAAPGDYYFDNVECLVDGVAQTLEQAGGNVSIGYKGKMDAGDRVPITTPYFEAGLCPVNVHWHLGAEHLSDGEYDELGNGPSDIHHRRAAAGKVRKGNLCHLYDDHDEKFITPYDWKYCKDMEVGQTYEVHWPHSAAGACGTVNQYQTPFYDGVFCVDGIISLDPLNTYRKIGVQAQVFTVVNDENYYYPNLFNGMIVDTNMDMGTEITKYTGSTTGTSRDNEICSRYTPITWQVDRKCNLISASSFDKMCADMMAQKDDMGDDLHPHGSRVTTADRLTANNHINRRRRYLR